MTAADQRFSSIMYKVEPTCIRNDFFCFKVHFIVTCNIEWVHSKSVVYLQLFLSCWGKMFVLGFIPKRYGFVFFLHWVKGKTITEVLFLRIICYFYWFWPNISKYGLLNRTKRLLFKLFRITKFRTRSDKSIRSSILSKLKN